MVPEFTIPFVIGLATGFILGYGVRKEAEGSRRRDA
jgi:hypothetical protein